jgi:hypothetical protein
MRLPAITIFLVLASSAGAASLDDLAWMTGHWRSESERGVSEELWMPPEGSVMLGLNRVIPPGKRAFFEFLRIEDREGTIEYIAQPGGDASTSFRLVSVDGKRAVFENPDHDFPQRITYWIHEGRLCARAESIAEPGQGPEWCWSRQ